MINVNLICVGNLSQNFVREGCNEYYKRLKPFCNLNIIEVTEEKLPDKPSEKQIETALSKEGEEIIKKVPRGAYVVALCIEGNGISSTELAKRIEKVSTNYSKIAFVIGSSYGLSQKVKDSADFLLSLGQITLPHQLARLVLSEQIYRAFSINGNMKYHK